MVPFFLFENLYEIGTPTASTEDPTRPVVNVSDWRPGTPYRWAAADTVSPVDVEVDLGGGSSAQPTTVAIGGHNLSSADAQVTLEWSDNGADWTPEGATQTPTDDLPFAWTVTPAAVHQWWRVRIEKVGGGAFLEPPEVGILTLGRRLDFEHHTEPSLDPYGFELATDASVAESGAPLGANVRFQRHQFLLSFQSVGLTRDWHRGVGGGLSFDGDYRTHAETGAPWWWAWDLVEEPSGLYLCQLGGRIANPFRSTYKFRRLSIPMVGWRETA